MFFPNFNNDNNNNKAAIVISKQKVNWIFLSFLAEELNEIKI